MILTNRERARLCDEREDILQKIPFVQETFDRAALALGELAERETEIEALLARADGLEP